MVEVAVVVFGKSNQLHLTYKDNTFGIIMKINENKEFKTLSTLPDM